MARIKGLEPQQAGWLTRLLYWFTRRGLRQRTGQDRLPEPVKFLAYQPALLRAVGRMEMAQGAARLADFEYSDAFNELEKEVLRFATHLTLTPAERVGTF
jgi:hypothetical protein